MWDFFGAYLNIWIICLFYDTYLSVSGAKQYDPLANCSETQAGTVYLTACNLTQLDPHHFEDHGYLTTLVMSHNRLFHFPRDQSPFLYHPTMLQYYCNFCGITDIYELTFSELRQLKILSLQGVRDGNMFVNNHTLKITLSTEPSQS
ncbi:uncharacterized protein LOC134208655 isoform X2 [Armigeres subalbatus]|uniref:uncharacterized protein LOC134208655 isoform X2 n=1 Tax=Armigeres subalbatus TaxID=124917 RepID=UPI002ED084DF